MSMGKIQQADAVDAIIQQWRQERPDLDTREMGVIGRLKRCAALLQHRLDETFSSFDMTNWEFDVLATLRRSGAPYRLTPTSLFSTMMVTSGTMTHRMQRLEARGLIKRIPNEEDARSMMVQLTTPGIKLIDRAVAEHIKNEHNILAPLKSAEFDQLEASLKKLLAILEPVAEKELD